MMEGADKDNGDAMVGKEMDVGWVEDDSACDGENEEEEGEHLGGAANMGIGRLWLLYKGVGGTRAARGAEEVDMDEKNVRMVEGEAKKEPGC
jgi:hypothetical protein